MKKSHRSTETCYELSTNKISPRSPPLPPFLHSSRFLVIDATSSVNFSSWITGDRVTKLAEQFFVRRRVDDSCICIYVYVYSCVYRASSVEQVSTKQKRDTKFRKTFRSPLIFLPECLLFDASRRSLCHGSLPRILGPVQIPRKMVLHLQSTPFQYPFSHVLSDFQTSIRVLSTQPTSSEHNRSEIEIVGLGFRHIYESSVIF